MAIPNRAALIAKTHKTLKKHYTAVPPDLERPLLEQLLFACCLENAPYAAAEEALRSLQTSFFDWNEVRVSTVNELAEAVKMLPDPASAAAHVRRILQVVFETTYSFDLEALKKQNLGPATQRLQKLDGTTPFIVAYGVQTALGGHSIPLDRGALEALAIVGVINEAEQREGVAPGLERAIPKNKGLEFGSLLHQLGAELVANPFSTNLHKILLEINPDAKERLPKRQAKKAEPEQPPAKPAAGKDKSAPPAKEAAKGKPSPAAKEKPAEPAPSKKKPPEPVKKPVAKKSPPPAGKKKEPEVKKKSAASGLSKRKPR